MYTHINMYIRNICTLTHSYAGILNFLIIMFTSHYIALEDLSFRKTQNLNTFPVSVTYNMSFFIQKIRTNHQQTCNITVEMHLIYGV